MTMVEKMQEGMRVTCFSVCKSKTCTTGTREITSRICRILLHR